MPAGPSTWLLAPLAAVWMAGGIVDSLIGGIGWVTSPVYDWVRRLVNGVVGWVSDWIHHVIDWAQAAFEAAARGLRSVSDFAASLVGWAQGMVGVAFDRVVSWVGTGLGAVRNFAQGLVNGIADWAMQEFRRLWSFANGIFEWVIHNVWDPLWARIEAVFGWVQSTIIPWVAKEIGRIGDYARGLTDWVVGWVKDLVLPFYNWARPLLDAVSKAFGWIVWIGAHPYDWFVKTWHTIGDLSPEAISGMVARAMRDDAGHIEAELVRWFD